VAAPAGALGSDQAGAAPEEAVEHDLEHFRGVAEKLRGLAAQMPYDIRSRDQLLALAAGFDRFVERLELQAAADE
jgi:hypothetical protein